MAALPRDDPGLYALPTEKHATILPEAVFYERIDPDGPNVHHVETRSSPAQRICGLRRRLFVIVVIVVIIIAGIVGGTVGGILSQRGQKPTQTSNAIPSGTATPDPSSTEPIFSEPVRQITACECNTTRFITHQDERGELYMRAFYSKPNLWASVLKLNTTIAPQSNTPLASVCWASGDQYFELRITYISKDRQSTQIAAKCPEDGSPCYSFSYTQGANTKWKVDPGLAFTSTGPNEVVMFGLDDDGTILQRAYTLERGSLPFSPAQGLPKAHKNSPLGVDISKGELSLFWFDETFALQTSTSSSGGTSWTKAEALPVNSPSKMPAAIGVATSENPDVTQVFFLGEKDMRTVVHRNDRWEQGYFEASFLNSTIGFGPVAAVGWDTASVRLYYISGGQITELANEAFRDWSKGSMPPYSY